MPEAEVIVDDIRMSARRMVAALNVAKVEQERLRNYFIALKKYDGRGALSRLAGESGISKQLLAEVIGGRKPVGAASARKIARGK